MISILVSVMPVASMSKSLKCQWLSRIKVYVLYKYKAVFIKQYLCRYSGQQEERERGKNKPASTLPWQRRDPRHFPSDSTAEN